MTCAVSTRKNKNLKKHYAVFDLVTFVFDYVAGFNYYKRLSIYEYIIQ